MGKNDWKDWEQGYAIIRDGHTMFAEDICKLLDRLDYLETKLQNPSSNSEYMSALNVIEEYKQTTPEDVRSCLGVECFAKQRLNQRS